MLSTPAQVQYSQGMPTSGPFHRLPPPRILLLLPVLALSSALPACCLFKGHYSPVDIARWQDPSPPRLSLREKAAAYQERLESHFQTPEGLLKYRRQISQPDTGSYGDQADGCFHTGLYLASQALRLKVTGDPAAEKQVRLTLGGLRLLMEVTGKRGLLARHLSPAGTIRGLNWLPSPAHPAYVFRHDVSKDQYAGFIHGLGVTLAVLDQACLREEVRELATAAADHVLENRLDIVDVTGRRTRFGDLQGRFLGFPQGVNALIALALIKVAAESSGEARYHDAYRALVEEGYPRLARASHIALFDRGKRVNDHMAYLAIYPLLVLEKDPRVLRDLRDAEERSWGYLRGERNAFFAFVHGGAVEPFAREGAPSNEGKTRGRAALLEFPDDKVEWPVDLTRSGFDFPRAFLSGNDCDPRSTRSVPLYLRPRGSSFWVSNPYRLAGNLESHGDTETAGMDYLLAYWLGRYHGFVGPEE